MSGFFLLQSCFCWLNVQKKSFLLTSPYCITLSQVSWFQLEPIFFLAAGTELCFGFSMRIMLLAHWWFGYCLAVFTQSQGLSAFHGLPVRSCTRNWEVAQLGQLTQISKGIFHSTKCHAQYINWGMGCYWEGLITAQGQGLASVSMWWAAVSCISCVSWVLFLSLFVTAIFITWWQWGWWFLSFIKLGSYLNSQVLSFFFQILFPILCEEGWGWGVR